MTARDGGLRQEFRKRFPKWDWQSIETGETGRGVPDSNFCAPTLPDQPGIEGWLEYKKCDAYAVRFQEGQPGWISRRVRRGGRVFICVRRLHFGNSRRAACDELHIIHGQHVELLVDKGLTYTYGYDIQCGGFSGWDWDYIGSVITG